MVWYENLYVGKNCSYKISRLKYKIAHRQIHPAVYLIALPSQDHVLLEIIPSALLIQPSYPMDDLIVIGIAADRQEALRMTAEILELVYQEEGHFDVPAYLHLTEQPLENRGAKKV